MPTLKALVNAISEDTGIAAKLDTFDFGDGAEPAVFARQRPMEAKLRAVVVAMIGGPDIGGNGLYGMQMEHDIHVEDDKSRNDKVTRETAWLIYYLFHKQEVTIDDDGYGNGSCFCQVPVQSPTELGFPGYMIRVRIMILKTM